MTNPEPTESAISAATEAVSNAIRAAYEAGFAAGGKAALEKIIRAATGEAPDAAVSPARPVAADRDSALPNSRHWNSSEVRPFAYGAVTNAFRKVLRSAPDDGMDREALLKQAAVELNVAPDSFKYRDTFKRLRESNEMLFRDGRYFRGPSLIGSPRNENGALNGHAASAPDAGGVAAPSPDSRASGGIFD